MKKAIYPGTFDPITFGHLDIIKRAVRLFDHVVISVAENPGKNPLFTAEERVKMIEEVCDVKNVSVDRFQGLLVEYAKEQGAIALIRGLRAVSDFEYEFQMALVNRKLSEELSTVFLMPHEQYTHLNSSIVREVASFGGDVSPYVPGKIVTYLKEKFSE
ncbi:MAG: pantetheine-phosphate adenylyltransferase [Candidatus Marinimicrobia bacterium]|nr:pantetheine-phosphate adenylyltransferase [Candidatus Neomarinimicrobiota bacterium]MCF7827714.1 pantetheine-phosphate adenylyltransferase [Candidatus Neomarinimicrobiota bacterium]MCF7881231.1 pantetheine-phosphate adenylyltransferase [Candidatus Neomarinimicrobiota bacterium]